MKTERRWNKLSLPRYLTLIAFALAITILTISLPSRRAQAGLSAYAGSLSGTLLFQNQQPNPSPGTGTVTYKMNVFVNGPGNVDINFSFRNLPIGINGSVSPSPMRFTNLSSTSGAIGVATITLSFSGRPTGSSFFEVRATDGTNFVDRGMTLNIQNSLTTTTAVGLTTGTNPSVFGQPLAFTATVTNTSSGATPAGSVQFFDGASVLGAGTALSGSGNTATSSFTTTQLPVAGSPHNIRAVFTGTGDFLASEGSRSQTVNKANTTASITNVAALGTATVTGQSYSVAAGVAVNAPGAGTPTGSLTVSDGSATCTINFPSTSCNLTSTTAGAKNITATYNGDGSFNSSTSAAAAHQVNKANTTTTVTSTGSAAVVGQAYAVNWSTTVSSPGAGTLAGNVTVSDGAATCTAAVGAGTCNLTSTTAGPKSITATYAGNADFNGGASSGQAKTINSANTTVSITNASALGTATVIGQAYAVNWSVAVNSPGSLRAALSGNVTVSDGSGGTCTAAVSAGTCSLTSPTLGTKTVTASYAGDTNYNGHTSAGVTHTVNKPATTTSITNVGALGAAPVAGESYSVEAGVSINPPGTGTPTGTITVSDGTGGTCLITLPATNCLLTSASAGAKTITATYSGDDNLSGSAGTAPHTVNKAGTTTSITNAAALSAATVVGQSYSVAASVSVNAPGAGMPTGTVTVSDGAATCTITLPATSCDLSSATVGAPKTITATYNGDGNFNGSVGTATHTVTKTDTTTTVTNAATLGVATVVGQAYAVNWQVTVNAPGSLGAPLSGSVTVSDGTGGSCTAAVSAGTCNLTSTSTGGKTVTASYAGDANYNDSSGTAAHTVSKPSTTTTITNAVALGTPTVTGESYSVAAGVSVNLPGAGTPTGTITVGDGTGGSCAITLPQTNCTLTSTSAGAKTITATYNGDDNFNTSSGTASHTVNRANITLSSLTDSPKPTVTGQAYTAGFAISVTAPGAGTPTGTVTVSDGTGGTCTATLPALSCQLTSASAGSKTLTFTYNGDDNFSTSSNTTGHLVNKASTTTTVTAHTPNPSVFGQGVVVNFTVSADAPGGGTPTGNVTVSDGVNSCTSTVAVGACTIALATLNGRTLTATYAGDANYNGSISAGVPHTVNKAETATTITSDNPDTSALNQPITVAFTVAAAAPGAGTPTGGVTVTVSGGAETCTGTVAAGSGSCTLTLTTAGNHVLTATYLGDANFNGSASPDEAHTVVAPPVISKAFSPSPAQPNTNTTLTFTITNPAVNTVALTGVGFTDAFPNAPNLVIVGQPNVTVNGCGTPAVTDLLDGALGADDTGIKLSGATIAANSTCTVSVSVTPKAQGPFDNITGNVGSANGGAGNRATARLLTNTPPTITSNNVPVKAGSNAASYTIATLYDPDQPFNTVGLTINGSAAASSNGVTVSNLSVAPSGTVTAQVSTTCAATAATFNLMATDNESATGSGTLTVTVAPNTPPVLSYNAATVVAGTTPVINPALAPNDNGTINPLMLQSVSPAAGLGLNLNPATGQLAVTSATLAGNYAVTVAATDNCGATTNANFTVTVACPAIMLSPASLPNAAVNTTYPQTITALPAGTTYSFAVTSGLLPTGLTLNSNGSFSGAPTQSGTFNFRVTASGWASGPGGCSAFRDYVLVVTCPGVTLTPANLPGATVGSYYDQTISVAPGGSYSYNVTSGALPSGLTLNSATGAITGSPTMGGTFNFRISATSGSCSGTRDYTVTIACAGVTITTASLPAGTAGNAYSQPIAISPAGNYTFSLQSGGLPGGLTLNSANGVISGLATVTGNYSFTIKATAATGCAATQTYTLAINCPAITLSSLPTPTLNSPYNQTAAASPSGGGYSFAVTLGTLPAGLSLNAATGLVSGTPTTAEAYNFTITATGFGACPGSRAYAGTIAGGGCPAITLLDLPGGQAGQLYNHSATASPVGSYSYTVTAGSLPPGVTLYGSLGMLFGYPTQAGTFNFTITATNAANCNGSKQYSLVIGGAALQSLVFGDFDGDGKADLSVWRGKAGEWLTINSGDGQLKTEAWGSSAAPYFDVMTPGDYDGDGKMDLAVFRKSTGEWLIKGSRDGAVTAKVWGVATDVPVPGDYDGDGKTDLAVWRGADSNWYILRSSDGQTESVSWGTSRAPFKDVPVRADYDGDGKTDVAVFRQSNGHWYIRLSSDGSTLDKAWGLGSDLPVAADYDGDGKADFAVWRGADTNWYVLRSSDGQTQSISWGAASLGDVPAPADYDGDGKADAAIWRAADGNWYIKVSRDDSVKTIVHGQRGDLPLTSRP